MYYIEIGEGFSPVEEVRTHEPGKLVVLRNTPMARYVAGFCQNYLHLLRINGGKADYWSYKVKLLDYGNTNNDFEITFEVEE